MLKQLKLFKEIKDKFSGFTDALNIYKALKNETETVNLPKLKRTLHFRKGSKDYETFHEVFIASIYNLDVPFVPKNIVDAGANTGLASLFFKMKYPDSNIVSIEIDAGNVEMINKNLKGFNNIQVLQKGLYNKNTFFKIEDPFNATNSFVVKEVSKDDNYDIEAVTLDDIIKDNNWDTIDILKIDIEGAEMQLFESNYENWLPKVKVIYIETHDRMIPKSAFTVMNTINKFDEFILYTTTEGTLIFHNTNFVKFS